MARRKSGRRHTPRAHEPAEPAADQVEVGKRLRALRLALGLRQKEMAARVGLTPPAWNHYERGNGRPLVDIAIKISLATGVGLNWIYRGDRGDLPVNIAKILPPSSSTDDDI